MQFQAIEHPRSPFEGADQIMTTAGAAKYLGFSVRTLQAWRVERKGPPLLPPMGSGPLPESGSDPLVNIPSSGGRG
jgi:hypothetical protein